MSNIVIVSATRTAIGSFNGSLAIVAATELGQIVITEALKRAGINAQDISEVIMGNVLQAGLGQNPARQAALLAKIPTTTPTLTINKVCGSGLKAVTLGAQALLANDAEIVVAGGMENMTRSPYILNNARWGFRMGDQKVIDTMVHDGLTCASNHYHMGITAENVAEKYGLTRLEQDEFALLSQQRAAKALANNIFAKEITPVVIKSRKGESIFNQDEYVKTDATLEGLTKLRAAFKPDGTVTAGNSSGLNDGAAALVLTTESKAKALGLKPLARIRGYASGGVDPALMGLGPIPATQRALQKTGLTIKDIDLIEANEAFSAQFLAVGKVLNFDLDKTNVDGGAIALGHPIGASGARILVSLLYGMQRKQATLGLATLCIGGGQGIAVIVERM